MIADKKIMITGATGGIGRAVAEQLARRGATLIPVGRDALRLAKLAGELQQFGTEVTPLQADLNDESAPARLLDTTLRRWGGIDILINCAGTQNFGDFARENAVDTAALFKVNVLAPMALTNAVLPHMIARGSGKIVNVGSIFGSIGFPFFATYSASKFALRGFSEALRRELAGSGVDVTYVAPRFTRTSFNRPVVTRMAGALKMNQDEPAAVARCVVRSIERNESERYLGWPEKLFVRINSVLPRLVDQSLIKQREQMQPFATEGAQ